ncbi:hypothetical protein [Vibrio phage VP06]|nr:hypothetical protein [Vibrio phage VP06]
MLNLTISKSNIITYLWTRNVLSAEGGVAFIPALLEVEFVFGAESLSESEDVAPHEYLSVHADGVLELFDKTHITWDKDDCAITVTSEISEYYGGNKVLQTPYNPTLENVSGMIYAVMHRLLCASNFGNSEDPELELMYVKVTDSITKSSSTFSSMANEGRMARNATTFKWNPTSLESAALDVAALFSQDVRIDVPVAEKTVDKYE